MSSVLEFYERRKNHLSCLGANPGTGPVGASFSYRGAPPPRRTISTNIIFVSSRRNNCRLSNFETEEKILSRLETSGTAIFERVLETAIFRRISRMPNAQLRSQPKA